MTAPWRAIGVLTCLCSGLHQVFKAKSAHGFEDAAPLARRTGLFAVAFHNLSAHFQPLRCTPAIGSRLQVFKDISELLAHAITEKEETQFVVVQVGTVIKVACADKATGFAIDELGMQLPIIDITTENDRINATGLIDEDLWVIDEPFPYR